VLYPQLVTFDSPDTLSPACRRDRSINPLQALTLLNDPVFFEAAQGLSLRVLKEKQSSLSDRIDYAFKVCLARPPSREEKERLLEYHKQQESILTHDPRATEDLFPFVDLVGIDPREAAIWVSIASILLNLDEFTTRE
jgi:uncharacterized protein DUF1553